jgi:hypothetical protein
MSVSEVVLVDGTEFTCTLHDGEVEVTERSAGGAAYFDPNEAVDPWKQSSPPPEWFAKIADPAALETAIRRAFWRPD